jgi:hypothetical protein
MFLGTLPKQRFLRVWFFFLLAFTDLLGCAHVLHVGSGKPVKNLTDGLGKTTTSAMRGVHKTTESATNGVTDTLTDTVTGVSNADIRGITSGATGGLGRTVSGTGEALVSLKSSPLHYCFLLTYHIRETHLMAP